MKPTLTKSQIHEARKWLLEKLRDFDYCDTYPNEAHVFEIMLIALSSCSLNMEDGE